MQDIQETSATAAGQFTQPGGRYLVEVSTAAGQFTKPVGGYSVEVSTAAG